MGVCNTSCQSSEACDFDCQITCQNGESYCQTYCEFEYQEGCGACESRCQDLCQYNCVIQCEFDCQSSCEKGCQSACENSCQSSCESYCQSSCEQHCQDSCEDYCQSSCEHNCQDACQKNCTDLCEGSCQAAESCDFNCQINCEQCESDCQTYCEFEYQSGCESCQTNCQDLCEHNCVLQCEFDCQSSCEKGCESVCENSCQESCETSCQSSCEQSCQENCTDLCQGSCQAAESCDFNCQVNCEQCESDCQTYCEFEYQNGCESCQTNCQDLCEHNCVLQCEFDCQSSCESNCESSNENGQGGGAEQENSNNNSFSTAQEIHEHYSNVEHYECYVNKVGDEDYYKVKFDQDGKVNFYIRPEDSKLDISLYVYDENKVLISSKNDTGQGGHELILQIPVKLNKYYYIKVVHINGTVSDVNKKYILRCKNYPNEKSLTNGIDRLGGIDYIGDKDLYEVNITKTGLVEFLVKPSKESLEMNLDLIDSDKDTVISSKDNVDDGNNPISIVKNLTKGTYYLSVSDAGIHNNVGKLYYISYDYADINVTGITISPSNVTLDSGGSTKLSIHITPDNATNKKIVWSSSDNKIATIESDGIVCAKGKGICTITATTEDGNYSDSVMVTVNSNENINATGKITNDTTIYYGPDTSIYPSIDTINNQVVSILWKENSWYYIECNVNGSSQKQRGYIQASFVSDTSPIIITKNHISSIGFCTHSTNAYSGPNTIYKQSGSVSYCEVVKIFNLTEGLFTFIEYHIGGNKKKRAYILTNLINTSTKITRIKKQQMYLNLMGVKDDKTRSIDTIEVAIPMDECGTRLRYFHPDIDGEKLITQSSFDTLVSLKKRIFKDNISASRITSLFGEYYVPNKTRQKVKDAANNTSIVDDAYFKALHEGIDMVSDIGCKFYAFGNGKVIYNGITDTNSHGDGFHLIAIEYDTLPNYAVMYAHAKELNPDLRKKLKQGEELRVTANTWLGKQGEKAPFPMNEHLHLEIRKIEKKKNMAPSTKNYTLDNKEIDVYNLIERL